MLRLTPLAAALCLGSGLSVAASDSHNPGHKLEEVIVSASPIHGSHSDNARPIAVLSGDELRNQASATLADTLQGQTGVSNASFGPGVGNPVIRGQSGNRVKLMQDNLDTLDASGTSADHANTTEPLLADQIEILRGPATLRFGSGAIGGVVNVIDNRIPQQAQTFSGAVESRYSSHNDGTASVLRLDGGGDVGGQTLAWHADGLLRDSNNSEIPGYANPHDKEHSSYGVLENSNSEASAYTLGGSWVGERGFIGLAVNRLDNDYGIPAGAHEHHDPNAVMPVDDHEDPVRIVVDQTRYDLKGEYATPDRLLNLWRLRVGHNRYEHREMEGAEVGTLFSNDAWEGRLEALHGSEEQWQGAIGLQFNEREYGARGEEAFIPGNSRIRSQGLFWIGERHWQHQWIELGVRHEQQSIDPDDQRAEHHSANSLSGGYHFSLSDVHNFSLQLSRAQRAPGLEELFADGAHVASQTYDLGNRQLQVETSHNIDAGYEWQPIDTSLLQHIKLNLFYNRINDFIYQANTGVTDIDSDFTIYEYRQEDAHFRGLETEALLQLSDRWQLRLFGDAVRARLQDGGDVPRLPPYRVGAQLRFETALFFGDLQFIHADDQDHPGVDEEATDGYQRLDASLNWPLPLGGQEALLFVRGSNLLDEDIRHSTSQLREVAPEPGRSFTAGVRVSF
ncbi:TonB-dependent receptor [Pseudomaricurvus sp. HS19]|uniref:TonB-dependent receptor n=1 Tax=Pseudomaricurvus sp. HS19 TaxID=2692626 RepID=UPI00136F23D1|nr:TonB-dependent receptor [Pseudomaricurvus sp. HS19]MYM63618.1 TonB-dependent receptor [Pseudomaricurvus sp. HS19]